MTPHTLFRSLALGLMLLAPAALGQATGDRYRVTTSVEMPGMNISMPGQTNEVCTAKNQSSQEMVPMDENCQLLDYRTSGNKSTFRMRCTGDASMEGRGEFERLGADAYRGMMDITAEGQRMIMRFEGKRIGDCNYARENPLAQANASMAQTCEAMLGNPGDYPYMMRHNFLGPDAMCASHKRQFCARMTALSEDIDSLHQAHQVDAQHRSQGIPTSLWESFEGCGLPRARVVKQACDWSETADRYEVVADFCPERVKQLCGHANPIDHGAFLARQCPEQARAFAAQHCARRGYTAVGDREYADFCNHMSAERLRGRAQGEPADSQPAQPAQEDKKKSGVRDRLRGLRDLLGG